MALTETRPEADAISAGTPAPAKTLDGLIGSSDHKTIGRLWIGGGLFFLVVALAASAVAGFEASDLDGFALSADDSEFTQLWSFGRVMLFFGGLVPILVGLGTYLVPLQIGAPALAFARGASGAFWAWLLGAGLTAAAYVLNGGPGGGRADFIVLWAVALAIMLSAIAWALVVLATTILGARTTGMSLERVPHTTWSFLVFSLIGLLSLPVIIAELALVYVRVRHGIVPLEARGTLTGVMEAVSLPPGLYWLAVPAFGMAADTIGVHTSRPVKAHRPVLVAIGVLGFFSYGADVFGFATVRPLYFNQAIVWLAAASAILPMLAVLGLTSSSLRKGELRIGASLVGALVSGLLFLLAAVVALLGAIEPVALFLHNELELNINLEQLLVLNGTTFHDGVRGIVVGATVVALISALTHWGPKIWGRRLADPLSMLAILSAAGGAVLWGAGGVLAGVDDQPAYPAATLGGGENVEFFNLIAFVGIALVAVGALVLALNVAQAAFSKGRTGTDPWIGATLEWATATPPSIGNFETPPVVRSATPLADTIAAVDEEEVMAAEIANAGEEA